MIIKRIADGIRKQDWFQVVIEIIIVVVGIFLGLQVTQWNDARQDRSDESEVLARLHEDILLMQNISSRVVDRRQQLLTDLVSASDLVFDQSQRGQLTQIECNAIGDSSFASIPISGVPSLSELQNEGRLGILQDTDLRVELTTLQQRNQTFKELVLDTNLYLIRLIREYPALMTSRSYFDEDLKEYQLRYQCDLVAMQSNTGFISGLSDNIDAYDAYLRDGLIPWRAQVQKVHQILDAALNINH